MTATGEAAVKPIKASKQMVKQVMPKSKSMSSINKKTRSLQQPLEMTACLPEPKEPEETHITTIIEKPQETPLPPHNNDTKTAASVKPVQKVTPMVKTKTTPENNQENSVIYQRACLMRLQKLMVSSRKQVRCLPVYLMSWQLLIRGVLVHW